MENWSTKTDEEVFANVSEQPSSQASYLRDVEIRRRHYLLDVKTSQATIAAAEAQEAASKATSDTAVWTKRSAIAVFVTTVTAALALLLQIFSMLGD